MQLQHIPFYTLNILLHSAVYITFIIYAFKSRIKKSPRAITFWVAMYIIFTCVMILLFLEQNAVFAEYGAFGQVAWMLVSVFSCMRFLKNDAMQMCFLIFVTLNIQNNIISFSKIINAIGLFPQFKNFSSGTYLIISVFLLILHIPLMWLIHINLFKRVVDTAIEFVYWKYIWVIPLLYIILLHCSPLGGVFSTKEYLPQDLIPMIVMHSMAVISYIVCLNMLIKIHDGMLLAEQKKLILKQLDMQKSDYKRLMERIKEDHKQQHDWRHHLLTINGLAQNKDYETLNRYLNKYITKNTSDEGELICNHTVVNIILRYFVDRARQNNIEVKIDVKIPEDLSIPDLDLCVVFGNLMENAVEACISQETGRRYIAIKSELVQSQLLILIRNSFSTPPERSGRNFLSSKHKGEGIGVSSVRNIAESGGGNLIIHIDNNIFTANVLLNIPS